MANDIRWKSISLIGGYHPGGERIQPRKITARTNPAQSGSKADPACPAASCNRLSENKISGEPPRNRTGNLLIKSSFKGVDALRVRDLMVAEPGKPAQ